MTPCEKLGYKVGDRFEVVKGHWNAKLGDIVTLTEDDGTANPWVEKESEAGMKTYAPHIDWIKPVCDATNAQSPGDQGWTEWHGGECPVERGTLVDVRQRDGDYGTALHADMDTYEDYSEGRATAYRWSHSNSGGDIIAYRLHKQQDQAMTLIEDLKAKRQAREEAEAAYQDALRAVREELGDGFTLEDNAAQADAVRDLPPEEWREGDLFVVLDGSAQGAEFEDGEIVRKRRGDDQCYEHLDGRDFWWLDDQYVKWHSRPTA